MTCSVSRHSQKFEQIMKTNKNESKKQPDLAQKRLEDSNIWHKKTNEHFSGSSSHRLKQGRVFISLVQPTQQMQTDKKKSCGAVEEQRGLRRTRQWAGGSL